MPLAPDAWLNHYEVLGHLGTGASQSRDRKGAGVEGQSRDCKGATTQLRSIA